MSAPQGPGGPDRVPPSSSGEAFAQPATSFPPTQPGAAGEGGQGFPSPAVPSAYPPPNPPQSAAAPALGASGPWPGSPYQPVAPKPSALPVEPKPYHQFWRAPAWRWWKGLLALVAFWAAWFLISMPFTAVAMLIDVLTGAMTERDITSGQLKATPAVFIANNLTLVIMIPLSLLLAWAIARQRPSWLSSVSKGFRWRWAGRVALIVVPLWALLYVIEYAAAGGVGQLSVGPNTVIMIIGILLTTPFQAAGEEYALRGYTTRAIGAWFGHPVVSAIVAGLVTSTIFTLLHMASNIWLNVFYFCFGAIASYLTWRTGGLEAAVVVHVTNNLLAEALLPFTDFSRMFERSGADAGSPMVLLTVGVMLLAVAGIELLIKFKPAWAPTRVNAPGAPALAEAGPVSGPGGPGSAGLAGPIPSDFGPGAS